MAQSWIIFAGLLIVVSARSASSTVSGTCASIGYSTSCCPPWRGDDCIATDGDCFCGADCHNFGDCCKDVNCTAQPRTCADVGITQCCNDPNGSGICDVHFRGSNGQCSCNVSCHRRNDCCPDAQTFCIPEKCHDAGKHPNCCNRVNALACYVPGGNCYCDPLCTLYHDCCADAKLQCPPGGSSRFSRMRLQSFQNDKGFSRRRFYNRERRIHREKVDTNYAYQEAPAARLQQELREFSSRPRAAGQHF